MAGETDQFGRPQWQALLLQVFAERSLATPSKDSEVSPII
jgi:hypothetical protein